MLNEHLLTENQKTKGKGYKFNVWPRHRNFLNAYEMSYRKQNTSAIAHVSNAIVDGATVRVMLLQDMYQHLLTNQI